MSGKQLFSIGAADAFITPQDTGIKVYVGLTSEKGITVEHKVDSTKVTSAQLGLVDIVLLADTVSVSAEFLDTSMDNVANLMPTTTKEVVNGKTVALTYGGNVGLKASDLAARLDIHPLHKGMDTSEDLIFYKAINTGGITYTYNAKDVSIIPAAFECIPDLDRPRGDQIYRRGVMKEYATPVKQMVSFYITPSNPTKSVGESVNMQSTAMYIDNTTENVTSDCSWVTSNTSVATIERIGDNLVVTAVGAGTTIISCNYGSITDNTTLTVTA